MEAIILAGGMGTRLQSVVSDLPKPMADINGRPFLSYLLDYLVGFGFTRVILSVGFKNEIITGYFGSSYKSVSLEYSIENERLGTGGAISYSLSKIQQDDCFVFNGDTFFETDLSDMWDKHKHIEPVVTMALRRFHEYDRYGSVCIDDSNYVNQFTEKKYNSTGLINAGIYILNKPEFLSYNQPEKYSFEKDFLEKVVQNRIIYAIISEGYFIDIGIPEDYLQAVKDFKLR